MKINRIIKIVFIPFLIAFLIYLYIAFFTNEKQEEFSFQSITMDEYSEIFENKGDAYIFVLGDNLEYNTDYENSIKSKFNTLVYKLDIRDVSNEDLEKFIVVSKFNDNYVIPMLLYIKDGVIVETLMGYRPTLNVYIDEFIEKIGE